MSDNIRPGEIAFHDDPALTASATLCFIGRLQSDWSKGTCPRNLTEARARGGGGARIVLDPNYALALTGLAENQAIWILLWMDRARRDLALQSPGHRNGPRGTFSLRSPVRPNPIAIEAVRITELDIEHGIIESDATDGYDGPPVLDITPYLPGLQHSTGPLCERPAR